MGNRKPIFVDRDGVLTADTSPYTSRAEQVVLLPHMAESLARLDRAGFDIFVISNQQGVARGITTLESLEEITEVIQRPLRELGFEIKKFYHCTALDSEGHPWRKPSPGMLLAARDEFGLDLKGAYFIGDKWSDIEAGARAGCLPLLVLSGVTGPGGWEGWRYQPLKTFAALKEAVDFVVDPPA
jgi:D-glycero-D-manno-heptose 1,7-bisphosphate phosphatase